jgi:hypothetical protein
LPKLLVALVQVGNRNFGTAAKLSRVIAADIQESLYNAPVYDGSLLPYEMRIGKWEEEWFWEAEEGMHLQFLDF